MCRHEHIGRVYSHTEHKHILGFKGLVLGRNDGKTFIPLDFSLHAEKGKEGNQGLSSKDRKARFSTDPGEGTPASVRHKRYQPIWEIMHKLRSVMGERDAMYELFTSET